MPTDQEIARRALDLQNRAKDVPLMQIPGYMAWSEKKLNEGVSEALIAHLDSMSMWLTPDDLVAVDEATFEDLLEDIASDLEE